jgi:L-fuculose-phosphate aldolase
MRADRSARQAIVAAARSLHERGWVANHDGNLTLRLAPGRFLATPTATSKARVEDGSLIEVDAAGARIAGTARPFGEIGLHLLVFERRPDIHAVVHAHPPHATAIACGAASSPEHLIERPFIAEAVVSLGAWIPRVPFALPGPAAREALAPYVEQVDAALLGNHGVIAWGADLEQAMLRLELVEHLARIALLARAAGGVQPLPAEAMAPLLAARARAGLGRAADQAAATAPRPPSPPVRPPDSRAPVVACAPAPHADVEIVTPGRRPASPDTGAGEVDRAELARIVREELLRALK